MTPKRTSSRWRIWITTALAVSLVLATTTVALARVDGDGGPWHAEAGAPYTPPEKADEVNRPFYRWNDYDEAYRPYASYTPKTTDETGRALDYWEAYEKAYQP